MALPRMKARTAQLVAAALVALSLGTVPALAQDSGVSGDLERTATATPQEKLQYAADAVEELKGAVESAQKLMDEARKNGETDQVECLGERLSQLKALSQVTEAAEGSMREALEQGNQERASHEMRKIAVALSKARQLSLEAQACTDDSGAASGNTTVTAEGGFEGEEDETDQLTEDVLDQGYDPPNVSPFN